MSTLRILGMSGVRGVNEGLGEHPHRRGRGQDGSLGRGVNFRSEVLKLKTWGPAHAWSLTCLPGENGWAITWSKEVVSQVIQRDQPLSPFVGGHCHRLWKGHVNSPSQNGHQQNRQEGDLFVHLPHWIGTQSFPKILEKTRARRIPPNLRQKKNTKFGLSIKYPPDIINQLHHPLQQTGWTMIWMGKNALVEESVGPDFWLWVVMNSSFSASNCLQAKISQPE